MPDFKNKCSCTRMPSWGRGPLFWPLQWPAAHEQEGRCPATIAQLPWVSEFPNEICFLRNYSRCKVEDGLAGGMTGSMRPTRRMQPEFIRAKMMAQTGIRMVDMERSQIHREQQPQDMHGEMSERKVARVSPDLN